jgi:hypothetical protein
MTRHRLVVAVSALLYVFLGTRVVAVFVDGWGGSSSDLTAYAPAIDSAVALMYFGGGWLFFRAARSGRTWRTLAIPILAVPAIAVGLSLFLLVLGGSL